MPEVERMKQRITQPGGACVDLVINTYTGGVVSRTPVNCAARF
jgi:hypothetical protein